MNNIPEDNDAETAQEQVATLRHQFTSALLLVMALSFIVTLYFGYECYFRYNDSQRAAVIARETGRRIEEFNKNNEPAFQEITRRLKDYSKNHPDLVPILAKYGLTNGAAKPAPPQR
jgi:hypothetical protein